MGRPKKLTPEELRTGVEDYFKSITYTKPLVKVVEGKDKKGKTTKTEMPILNELGAEIQEIIFADHPTMFKLARYLGIARDTLIEYGKMDEYSDSIKWAKEFIENYLEEKLYGSNVTGVIFNLKNNYGWEDRTKHDLGMEKSLEDYFKD